MVGCSAFQVQVVAGGSGSQYIQIYLCISLLPNGLWSRSSSKRACHSVFNVWNMLMISMQRYVLFVLSFVLVFLSKFPMWIYR